MIKLRHIFGIIALLLITAECGNSRHIDQSLVDAERKLQSNPDSSILILDKIRFGELSEEQAASWSRLMANAELQQGKTFLTDENFDAALKYYETGSDTLALINMYQLAAIKMRWLGRQDSAVHYLLKAIEIVPDASGKFKSELYTKLSNLYAFPTLKKDYSIAVKYAKLALSEAVTSEDKARALHDIGLFYSFQNNNDSAVIYMESALNEANPDGPDFATYTLNYANIPNVDLQRCVASLNRLNGNSLGKLLTMGFLYLNHSKLDSATHYLAESRKLYNENPLAYSINTYNNLLLLEQSIGLLTTGVVNSGEGVVANDSLNMILDFRRKISNEQRDYNNQLHLKLLESKAKRQFAWIISLVALLLIAVVFGFYVWQSKRRFLKLKHQLDLLKIEQILTECEEDSNEAETSTRLIKERLDICIEQFRTSKLQSEIEKMEMQYRNTGNYPSIKEREAVQKGLIGCFADFIVDLKMTGVKLNREDIITCVMTCLKDSNMAIAVCLGVTDTAIRTRKTRLRAKLPPEIAGLIDL